MTASGKPAGRRSLLVGPATAILTGAVLAGLEPWALPPPVQRWPLAVWIAMAMAGWAGCVLALVWDRPWRVAWQRAAVLLAVGGALSAGFRVAAPWISAERLCHHPSLEPMTMAPGPVFEWISAVVDKGKGLGIPVSPAIQQWLAGHDRETAPLGQWVECSRWRTRRAFVRAMLAEPRLAQVMVNRWDELFPAVTGPDVDLRRRRELLEMLECTRLDRSAAERSRHAATLWMGLAFLTDPPEFMDWRVKIRDALLATTDPPVDAAGDCWMRVTDCLLSFDDPAEWGPRTASFASWRPLLLRATRERVRGMAAHHQAIAAEARHAETRGEPHAALALWLDAGRLAAARPSEPGAGELTDWWGATLLGWVCGEQPGDVLRECVEFAKLQHAWPPEVRPALPRPVQDRIAECAMGWAARAAGTDGEERDQCIEITGILWPLLSASQQASVGSMIAPALVSPPCYLIERAGVRGANRMAFDARRAVWLGRVWPYLDTWLRADAGRRFREAWREAGHYGMVGALFLDAWSPEPGLSKDEWLLTVWAMSDGLKRPLFRPVAVEQVPSTTDMGYPLPLPVPEADPAGLQQLVDRMVKAWNDTNVSGASVPKRNWADALAVALGSADGERLPGLSSGRLFVALRRMPYQLRDRNSEEELRQAIHLGFCAAGVVKPTAEQRQWLGGGASGSGAWSARHAAVATGFPEWFMQALASPAQARAELASAIDDPDGDRLEVLLAACEKVPPGPDVLQTMWDWLLAEARDHPDLEVRLLAYTALLRLSPLAPADRRVAMREQFRRFFATARVPLRAWPREELGENFHYRPRGHGEGIPWDEDQLAAEWAWSSEVKLEADVYPNYGVPERLTGVFSYLAQAASYAVDEGLAGMCIHRTPIDEPVRISLWNRAPLAQPFEPTPWQRARQLHLRRPDLRFPDRLPWRPLGER